MRDAMHVIFDLDGTLIESEQIWEELRRDFVVSHGGQWRDDAQMTMIGMRTSEWGHYIRDVLHVPLPPGEIERTVVREVVARISEHVPVLPGATEALERISREFRLGLATSAALPVAQAALQKTGWNKYFAVVVSADEVQKGKPAPDVYVRTLQLLKADPTRTAAVEDSGNGIRSAHNADIAVIAIPNHAFPPDAAALAEASRVLKSLNDLNAAVVRDVLDVQVR
jgi:HAD superfamily hydrolase (TIGR01509 family)